MSILATAQPLEVDIKDAYLAILVTKYLAVFSCTLLIYDIIVTLPTEVRYVWASRWSFGRISYHANRCWGPILLAIYVPSRPNFFICSGNAFKPGRVSWVIRSTLTRAYLTRSQMYRSILVLRIWFGHGHVYCYERAYSSSMGDIREELNTVDCPKEVDTCACLDWMYTNCNTQFGPTAKTSHEEESGTKPRGCIFRNNPLAILPYIAPFLYETALFLMTVYKTWKISHGQPLETPLVTRLMRDGSQYYFVVIGTLIFIGLGSLVPAIRPAVNGSG
ncbi:hypothetical protein FRC12_017077, partial [Ceratobasidium sp. 428]